MGGGSVCVWGGLLVTLMGWLWSLSLWALCLACLLRGGRSTTTMDQPPPCLLSSDPHLFLHDLLLTSPSRQVFQPHLPLSPPDYSGIAQLLTATLCYTSPEVPTIVPPLSSPAQVSSSRQLWLTITSLGHTAPQFPTYTYPLSIPDTGIAQLAAAAHRHLMQLQHDANSAAVAASTGVAAGAAGVAAGGLGPAETAGGGGGELAVQQQLSSASSVPAAASRLALASAAVQPFR